jgi:muramidase (phage lysozyme)
MVRRSISILSVFVVSYALVSCGSDPSLPVSESDVSKAATANIPVQKQLWRSISKPAQAIPFKAKDGEVRVWVGSVRTNNHTNGARITSAEKAFLDVIAAAEGTSMVGRSGCGAHAGYESLQGCYETPGRISVAEMERGHPDRSINASYYSYAAGRYQFLPESFWEMVDASHDAKHPFPIRDFSPIAQDRAALLAIRIKRGNERVSRAGGLSPHAALLRLDHEIQKYKGNVQESHWKLFEGILDALSPEWASFPVLGTQSSFYPPQPAQAAIELWKVFKAAYKIYEAERKVALAAR